jgi:hypothetical protein
MVIRIRKGKPQELFEALARCSGVIFTNLEMALFWPEAWKALRKGA